MLADIWERPLLLRNPLVSMFSEDFIFLPEYMKKPIKNYQMIKGIFCVDCGNQHEF